jgi:hypothetical protein
MGISNAKPKGVMENGVVLRVGKINGRAARNAEPKFILTNSMCWRDVTTMKKLRLGNLTIVTDVRNA